MSRKNILDKTKNGKTLLINHLTEKKSQTIKISTPRYYNKNWRVL